MEYHFNSDIELNTGFTGGIGPQASDLTFTTQTIELAPLRDMGLLPPSTVLVDQAFALGAELNTGLGLDPATAELVSDYKFSALANSPKMMEQGVRTDLMNAMAAGVFNGYVQTLEATDPAALDHYRIVEGNIYLTGQLADNRLVFSFIDEEGFHYLRPKKDSGESLLAFIRDNNMSAEQAARIINRGVEKGIFAHVPHAAVEMVAEVLVNNIPGALRPDASIEPPVAPPPPVEQRHPLQNPFLDGTDFRFASEYSLSEIPEFAISEGTEAANLQPHELLSLVPNEVPFMEVKRPDGMIATVVRQMLDDQTTLEISRAVMQPALDANGITREEVGFRLNHIRDLQAYPEQPPLTFTIGGSMNLTVTEQGPVVIEGSIIDAINPETGQPTQMSPFQIVAPNNGQAVTMLATLSAGLGVPLSRDELITLSALASGHLELPTFSGPVGITMASGMA
jgi:hypothetical protein